MEGIIPPLVTPFDHTGRVCEMSVKKLIASLGDHFTALMPVLSSGEGRYLEAAQWRDMVHYCQKYGGGRAVYPGVIRETTAEVIALARHALELNVNGIAVTTPFGAGVDQPAIYKHFADIACAINLPIFLYNEELISGNQIQIETFVKLFDTLPICGVKDSSGEIATFNAIVAAARHIPVFQGWENLAFASRRGAGYIFPLANLECKLCADIYQNLQAYTQLQVDEICHQYGLFEEDWYRRIKLELCRRGVITTAQSAQDSAALQA